MCEYWKHIFVFFSEQHPDYREEEPPDWLVGVPDPDSAEEWEMLSFYRFVEIGQPEAFAKMLQVSKSRNWKNEFRNVCYPIRRRSHTLPTLLQMR